MQIRNDSGAVFTLHTNLGDLIDEMENKRKSVATLVGNITETTWTDDQSKKFIKRFEEDKAILMKLHKEMNEKQAAIKDLGVALEQYEKNNAF